MCRLCARVQTRAAALKALVETASGVPASAQRLLCRGRVLADEISMENARVEDGDTLLLVQRAPDAEAGAGAGANPNLARDPHAPDNVERRVAGRQGVASIGDVGDLSGLITQLFANAAPMVGGMPAHAMTLEFSIGAAPTPTPGATFGFARGDAQAAAVAAAAAAAERQVEENSEGVLRRFVATLERTIETVRASEPEMPPPSAPNVGAASTPQANAAEEEGASRGATHYGVQCDACNVTPVRGSRYKSVAHEDFDLCQACFTSGRGAARGPFARLDLPLPSGLPPIVINPNADNNDDTQQNPASTPRERSEVALGGLGEILRSAAALARASAPMLEDVAERFSPATRENTVDTQTRGLQLAAVMQSVGSLWCELARAVAVVPPPPGSGTTNASVDTGDVDYEDDVNAPRSLFAYPRLAHIAPSGAFPHTRPPGMPLHNSSTFVNGEPVPTMTTTTGRLTPAGVHIIAAGPEYEGVENLPAPVQNMLRRHMRAAEGLQQQQRQQQQQQERQRQQQQPSEAAPSAPPVANANDAVTAAAPRVDAPPTIAGGESATQGHETHSNRALSRFLGSMLRVIPSPSFTRAAAAPSADATRRSREVRSMLTPQTRAPTTTTTTATTDTAVAAGEASPSSPTRRSARRRSPDQNDAEHSRAAKASKVDDEGKSPAAAAAARHVRDKENEDATSSKSPVAGSSRGTKSKDATTEK